MRLFTGKAMKEATATPPAKKRYEWIDNSRVIAAFLIMLVHLPLNDLPQVGIFDHSTLESILKGSTYNGRVALFLMLSGYLFGRNAGWAKTWDRFIWLLVPFVLWNLIFWGLWLLNGHTLNEVSAFQVFGIGAVFINDWEITPAGNCYPFFDVPSWYMRDMLFLTLLTPFLIKIKAHLPWILLLFAAVWPFSFYMNPWAILSGGTCFYYCIGILLTNFKVESAYKIFNDKLTPYVIIAFVVGIVYSVLRWKYEALLPNFCVTLPGMLIGAMMIAHCGFLIEKHAPKLSKRLAPLGPASFLVFMLHYPIFETLCYYFPALRETYWILLLPIPTFIVIVSLFLGMKRYTPWLMPYLGHMKIQKKN